MTKKRKRVHFVGIGGIGVSSLARYFLSKGCIVSGSDSLPQNDMQSLGVNVFQGHFKENISKDIDLLIFSNAILPDNPEILEAKRMKIEVKSYPQALGEITKKYNTIAVSGTHGKGTTTAMLSIIMIDAGLDPTVIIGTKLKEFSGTNFRKGNSKYLLIEADEFKAAFLNYDVNLSVITNIEEDHLDFYKDINDINFTFQKYVNENLKKNGTVILNGDDKNCLLLKKETKKEVIEYSLSKKEKNKIRLSIPGKHNLYNALAAFFAAKKLGIKEDIILKSILKFKGTWRRFEEKNIVLNNGKSINLINDYAHHPTEVRATLQATKEKYPQRNIVVVFQPHQYERTYRFFNDFRKALLEFEIKKIVIPDIYTVEGRESKEIIKKVSAKKLSKEIKNSIYTENIEKTSKYLHNYLQGDEILVIMGAGDIYKLENYIKKEI